MTLAGVKERRFLVSYIMGMRIEGLECMACRKAVDNIFRDEPYHFKDEA